MRKALGIVLVAWVTCSPIVPIVCDVLCDDSTARAGSPATGGCHQPAPVDSDAFDVSDLCRLDMIAAVDTMLSPIYRLPQGATIAVVSYSAASDVAPPFPLEHVRHPVGPAAHLRTTILRI